MDLTYVSTHVADATGHLRGQFIRPRLTGLVSSIIGEVQLLEDTIQAVAANTQLDTAYGATLDAIAAMKNVYRNGMQDEVLRQVVRGAIAAEFNDSTLTRTRAAARDLFAGSTVFVKQPDNVDVASAGRPACLAFGIGDSLLPASAVPQSISILQAALPAGVVLARVFTFQSQNGAAAMDGAAPWVRGIGAGALGTTLYQNSIA